MCHPCVLAYTWTCIACEHSGRLEVPYRESLWTDAELSHELAPAQHEGPTIQRCPACGLLQRTSEQLPWAGEDSLPELKPAGEEDYLEALAAGLYEDRAQKLDLRVRAWRAGNDPSRAEGARAQIRSAEAQANLEALYDLLCADPSEALTKAEVARQLGRFEEALELLSGLSRLEQARSGALEISRLAREGSDLVGEVSWRDDYCQRFTCPHCQRPGRLGFGPYDRRQSERYNFDAALSSLHAVRCGHCRGTIWRGDQRRSQSFALESFSDGAVAALGCLALPSALVLSIFSPRAGLGLFLGYCVLVAASWVAGQVRRQVYPDSRPLTDMDFEDLLRDQDWSGVEEERWVRLSTFYARTREPAARCGLDSNSVALIALLRDEPSELWLEAKIRRRAGDLEGAREVAERIQDSEHEWYAKRAEKLVELLEAGDSSSPA